MKSFIDRAFYNGGPNLPKSKFKMCICTMREIPEEIGDKHFKLIDEKYVDCNGKQFRESLIEDAKNGIKHDIEVVYQRPTSFVFNKMYMLATRDMIWIWKLEDEA